ncbi:MAG: prenyltransferase/squalene oxidase repeat-containing protein [Maioricimonas sp. JB049]
MNSAHWSHRWRTVLAGSLMAVVLVAPGRLSAAGPDLATLEQSRSQAIAFLRTTQADDGSWTTPTVPGITALAVVSLLKNGVPVDDPTVAKGLAFIERLAKEDGGLYYKESRHRNYETAIAVMALQAANSDGRYDDRIRRAIGFLRGLQWDETENIDPSDPAYGGAGYGSHQRPDLSNTQFFMEALKAAGVEADDPAMQKALIFVSRSQNLESEHNTTPFAAKIDDGGFYYTPAAGGTSQAGTNPDGGLRSYASMTYAGLKSMIYAGLSRDDERVQAAQEWISRHYRLEENPGMGQQGLFYYYHTFAKTLSVLGEDVFVDSEGTRHDWRAELTNQLASLQQDNGSWINPTDRWYEGDPNLVTAYALLALSYCDPPETSP